MLLRSGSGRWIAAVLTGALCVTVAGCGADKVEGRAYDSAARQLPLVVSESVACVTQAAPQMLADPSTPSLQEVLGDCAGTTILNSEVDAPHPTDGVSARRGTVAVTGVLTGDELELTFYTEAGGIAEAGVSNARVTLATCWRIVVDDGPQQPQDISSAPCDERLIAYFRPTELVPFEDLDLR